MVYLHTCLVYVYSVLLDCMQSVHMFAVDMGLSVHRRKELCSSVLK